MIISTVMREKKRIAFMLDQYRSMAQELPRGSLSERKVKDRTYYYLKYREGGRVITKYIPGEQAELIRSQVDKRRHAEKMIVSLEREMELAERFLGGTI